MNSFIWPIDGITNPGQSGLGSNDNKDLLHIFPELLDAV